MNSLFSTGIAFVIAVLCALTGSGGPILIVPLMVALGMGLRQAVAVGVFLSIFIALPALAGYLSGNTLEKPGLSLLICCISHAAGIAAGIRLSGKINPQKLKKIVGIGTIASSLFLMARFAIHP